VSAAEAEHAAARLAKTLASREIRRAEAMQANKGAAPGQALNRLQSLPQLIGVDLVEPVIQQHRTIDPDRMLYLSQQ
jgi:hypothetical protein